MTESAALIKPSQHELFTPFAALCTTNSSSSSTSYASSSSSLSSFVSATASNSTPIATITASAIAAFHHRPIVAVFIVVFCSGLLPVSQQTMQKFCGKSLTDAMDLVCVNGYNDKISSSGPAARKRQANDFSSSVAQVGLADSNSADAVADEAATAAVAAATAAESYLAPTFVMLNTYALSPFVASIYANILAANVRHRRNGGVYDECCRKPCSYGELAAYCRSPN